MGNGGNRPTRPCKWCGKPVEQPGSRWRRRRYCRRSHRRLNRILNAVMEFLDFW